MLATEFEPGTSARAIAPSRLRTRRRVGAHHLAVDHIERGGRRLQQFGGGLDRFVLSAAAAIRVASRS
jgi:hypothetical protein